MGPAFMTNASTQGHEASGAQLTYKSSCKFIKHIQTRYSLKSCTILYRSRVHLYVNQATILWVRSLLQDFGFSQRGPTVIYQDNKSSMNIALSRKQQPGVKHIDIRHHFLRARIASKELTLLRKPTEDMVADIFTKSLPYPAFHKHRTTLRVSPSTD